MIDRTGELLAELSPSIFRQAYTMIVLARQAGIPLVIISGRRSPEENREVGGAERSWHLDGLAFDVAVWGHHRDSIPLQWWEALGVWGEQQLGLFWGGRFLHAGKPDVNHFDVRRQITST